MIRPNLQKDDNGNFIYYPCIFFAKKGYILPDKEAADKLDDSFMIIAAFPILWLALHINIIFLLVASFLYVLVIFIFRYRSVRKFSQSDRSFSWEYYANDVGSRHSKLVLYFVLFGMLCSIGLGVSCIVYIPNMTGVLVGYLLTIFFLFGFIMFLLAIYFKK